MGKKKIYTVATSHLDTIWSWDFETTVSKYIYDTLVDNIALFKKYPTYTFSFEGAYRYELMEEYYPELFNEMSEYIRSGRWNVCGSAYENGDTNCPSPEALFRNILIGNSYFAEKFNKRSVDIYLPDCFGFGWALPSIAAHSNLKGFTSQKLAWGSAYGVPFDIGKWKGVDGSEIYASINPHDYYFTLTKLRDWDFVQDKLKENEKYDLDWTYMFHGIGDRGGAPEEKSVSFVENEIKKNSENDIEVIAASADQIYHDIDEKLPKEVKDKLPVWDNELVMQNHGVGGYTSRAIGKRWNAKCQELGDMAERAGVMSNYYGVCDYNESVLEKSWKRAIAHQFHDDTPGTSVQRAYKRSWNDYAMSMNQFSGELESSLCAMSTLMKTDFCSGIPIMVYNSVECDRTSAVMIRLKGIQTQFVRVYDNNGKEVKSQIISDIDGVKTVLFIADVQSLGLRIYDVRPSSAPCCVKSEISINDDTMENQKYIVRLNKNGNISSIIDKEDDERELLSSSIALGLFKYNGSKDWPAWEMNFKEANKEPDRVPKIVTVKIAENGPARVAFEVSQKDRKSDFTNYISLTDGGKIVEVYSEIEWQSLRTMCKNSFVFTAKNKKATFDLGLGAIERENMSEKLFEVPAQKWADITDESGEFGVSVLSECKHGWDKFNDNTLRLTAIHTPKGNYRIDSMQSMMDLGLNRFSFAVFSHKGNVGAPTQMETKKFTQPLTALVLDKHQGKLGANYSFGSVSTNDVIIRAIKLPHHNTENGEVIVRLNEGTKKDIDSFKLTLGSGVESARELYASEEYKCDAVVENGSLVTSFKPYEVKTFALKLRSSDAEANKIQFIPIDLDYNATYITSQNQSASNESIPREIIPNVIKVFGGEFKISQAQTNNALISDGQTITVKYGSQLKLLCAGIDREDFIFIVDGEKIKKTVNKIDERFAGWDLYDFKEMAYIKTGHLGYEATHSHDENGKDIYAKGMYFWVVTLDVKGQSEVVLPKEGLIVLSACEVNMPSSSLVTPLYDEVPKRDFTFEMNFIEKLRYLNGKMVWNLRDKDNFITHYNNGRNGKRVEQTKKNLKSRTVESVGH